MINKSKFKGKYFNLDKQPSAKIIFYFKGRNRALIRKLVVDD